MTENLFAQETYIMDPSILSCKSVSQNDFQIACNSMTRSRINIFRVLAVSRVRGTRLDIKIRNKFIEIKYSTPNTCFFAWIFSVAISVRPHVCFISDLILISMFLSLSLIRLWDKVVQCRKVRDAMVEWLERLGNGAESHRKAFEAGLRHATTGKLPP